SLTERSALRSCGRSAFFFQAEDGIRDLIVTGVQTCALPIYLAPSQRPYPRRDAGVAGTDLHLGLDLGVRRRVGTDPVEALAAERSEERRVGKEGRRGRSVKDVKKKRRSMILGRANGARTVVS